MTRGIRKQATAISTATLTAIGGNNVASGLSIPAMIRAFGDSQDAEGLTKATQESYYKVLVVLARYLRTHHQVEHIGDITEAHLRQWMVDLRHEPGRYGERSSRTIQTYCRHMRPFFRWLHEHDQIPENPAEKIKLPKAKKTLLRIFEGDEIDRLQRACEPPDGRKATFMQKGLAARN